MLAVILKILGILGIILLALLCILVVIVLLVLFIPIVYRIDAKKDDTEIIANFKVRWLFGLLRAGYAYPKPGSMIVKILWFTIYDSGKTQAKAKEKETDTDTDGKTTKEDVASQADINKTEEHVEKITDASEPFVMIDLDTMTENKKQTLTERLFAKYEKIKYTIKKICDKIKHILENITFYKNLLQNEDTKQLFSHICKRVGKVLCHIRPRKLKADVIFGTGSPDTTGYAYAVYGMISPKLGKDVCITPDFTQQILTGMIQAAGHITIFTLLVNILAVLLDKHLRLFIKRIKMHSNN